MEYKQEEENNIQGDDANIMGNQPSWAIQSASHERDLQFTREHLELRKHQNELEKKIQQAIVEDFIDGSYPTVQISDKYRHRFIPGMNGHKRGFMSRLSPYWTSGLNYPVWISFHSTIDSKMCLETIPIEAGGSLPTIADAWKKNSIEKMQLEPPIIMCGTTQALIKDHPVIFDEIWNLIEPKLNLMASRKKPDMDRTTLLLLAATMGHPEVFSSEMLGAWAFEMEKSGSRSFALIGCPMFSKLMKLASAMKKHLDQTKKAGYPTKIIRYSERSNQIKIADNIQSVWFGRHPSNVRGLFDLVHGLESGSDAFDEFVLSSYGTDEERTQKEAERTRLLREKEVARIQRLEEDRKRTDAAEQKKREAEEAAALAKAQRIKEQQEIADRAKAARMEVEQKAAKMRRAELARIAQEELAKQQRIAEFNRVRSTTFQECFAIERKPWDDGSKPSTSYNDLDISEDNPVHLFTGLTDGKSLITFTDIQDLGRFNYGDGDWCEDYKTPKHYWDLVKEHTEVITSKEKLEQHFPKKKLKSIPGRLCFSTRILFRKTPERHEWSKLMQNPFYVEYNQYIR